MCTCTGSCRLDHAASSLNSLDANPDELEYRGVEVSLSPWDCQITLTCNRTRFILILERPTPPENDNILEDWFRRIEESEIDSDEMIHEQLVEDLQQSTILACEATITSILSSVPVTKQEATKQEAQSLEDVLYPTTFCIQLFSEQGHLQPYRIDNSETYLNKFEPVVLSDSLLQSTSILIPASDLDFIEDLYNGLVSKVSHNGKVYAFKRAHLGNQDQILREIQILQQISQYWKLNQSTRLPVPFFIGLVERHRKVVGFLEEFVEGTRLSEFDMKEVSLTQRRRWKQYITKALTLLHEQGFVWGDVKADNILVSKEEDLWLIDFGGSTTDGWVEQHLAETKEGDLQGMRCLVQYLGLRK